MLTRIRIGTRLYAGFGLLVLLSIAVIGVGWFGLNVAIQGLDGINGKLIPINVITAKAKYGILESKAAHNGMVAAFGKPEAIKELKDQWDAQQKLLDGAGGDFGNANINAEQKKNLETFRANLQLYRAAVTPVAEKLMANGYASSAEAWEAMQAAEKGFKPMYDMLAGIEAALQKGGAAIFQKIDGAIRGITLALLLIGALSIATAVLLGWRMAHSIVRPVHEVSVFAERMAAGDLSQPPLVAEGKDELAHMTHVLDRMQKSLVQVISKVREAADGIKLASSEVASGNHDLSARTSRPPAT
jgi:methyl-accepting chemotaxis protein